MKQSLLFLAFCAILTNFSNSTNAQSSCPVIVNGTFRIKTDISNPCLRQVTFDFINPTSGNKRINVVVTVSGTTIINECVDAGGQKDVQRNYTSSTFTACNMATIVVTLTSYTGSTCGGNAPCTASLVLVGNAPLPVSFSSFTAARSKDVVDLKWQTVTEINNKGFFIEKNTNGAWEQVSFIASKALNGNSTEKLNYNYSDVNSNSSMTQYRLKQTDIDGNSKYSDVRAIQGLGKGNKIVLFPNPTNDGKVNIVFDAAGERDVTIMDMTGRIIRQYRSFTSNSMQVANLVAGMYTVRTTNNENGSISMDKFVVAAH